MGSRSWEPGVSSKHPKGDKKGDDRARRVAHASCEATGLGAWILLLTPAVGRGALSCSPLASRGRGRSQGVPFGLKGSEGEPGLTHVSMVGSGGRRSEEQASCPQGRGYQSTAPSRLP